MKKIFLLILVISLGFYFYSLKEEKKEVIIEKVSPNHVFLSLEAKTKKRPDKSQYSVENLNENFRVVKFYYNPENLNSLKNVIEATEYKVYFKDKMVLRFNLLKRKDGNKDIEVITKEDPSFWSKEFNNLLQ